MDPKKKDKLESWWSKLWEGEKFEEEGQDTELEIINLKEEFRNLKDSDR